MNTLQTVKPNHQSSLVAEVCRRRHEQWYVTQEQQPSRELESLRYEHAATVTGGTQRWQMHFGPAAAFGSHAMPPGLQQTRLGSWV